MTTIIITRPKNNNKNPLWKTFDHIFLKLRHIDLSGMDQRTRTHVIQHNLM